MRGKKVRGAILTPDESKGSVKPSQKGSAHSRDFLRDSTGSIEGEG